MTSSVRQAKGIVGATPAPHQAAAPAPAPQTPYPPEPGAQLRLPRQRHPLCLAVDDHRLDRHTPTAERALVHLQGA